MKILNKSDLNLVASKLRYLVLNAWNRGNVVPYGIIYVSGDLLTQEDVTHTTELNKKFGWE